MRAVVVGLNLKPCQPLCWTAHIKFQFTETKIIVVIRKKSLPKWKTIPRAISVKYVRKEIALIMHLGDLYMVEVKCEQEEKCKHLIFPALV